jgi:hypothetical protein
MFASTHAHVLGHRQAAIIAALTNITPADQAGTHRRPSLLRPHVLVKDSHWDGEGGHGVGDVHNTRDTTLTRAARQQQVHLAGRDQGRENIFITNK